MPKAATAAQAPRPQLAAPNGPLIVRYKALSQYRVGPTDLDSIPPVVIRPWYNGQVARDYNVSDVVALDERLNSDLPDPDERAEETGEQILAFEAMSRFKLNWKQLRRIRPVSEIEMKERKNPNVLVYNLSDVEALNAPIAAAAVHYIAPVPRVRRAPVPPAATSIDIGPDMGYVTIGPGLETLSPEGQAFQTFARLLCLVWDPSV
ncbi:hypothetical protein B0H16DRAFT_87362 [Mycena metata]|uniref:Uncharacterized protein n=1 Tax=Mycena metata TaxID=1033252 RepID=A0AAD7JZP8_9AGAR|nr:hypothetical protein B0H16DRAFT_87362 [Mycena metata]